jgi:Transglycosylase SLT domain
VRRAQPSRLWPRARLRRRWWRTFRRASGVVQCLIAAAAVLTLSLAINWAYQVIRKPSELFFPVSGTLNKTPSETWRQYSPAFVANATDTISPQLLAAIAQVEGSGNPVARTYWRWSWTSQPFEIYRPASSAVGMYQITDGTFADARRFCIRDHRVVDDGPWNDWHSCWFNTLYARIVPGHAIELTSAHLDRGVAMILARHRPAFASLRQKQDLAALIHLCGAAAGEDYARRGFRLTDGQHCGDHDVRRYLAQVQAMKEVFARLAGAESNAAGGRGFLTAFRAP